MAAKKKVSKKTRSKKGVRKPGKGGATPWVITNEAIDLADEMMAFCATRRNIRHAVTKMLGRNPLMKGPGGIISVRATEDIMDAVRERRLEKRGRTKAEMRDEAEATYAHIIKAAMGKGEFQATTKARQRIDELFGLDFRHDSTGSETPDEFGEAVVDFIKKAREQRAKDNE